MSKILLPKFERFRAIGRHIPKWSDPDSLYFRLPEHYKQRHRDFLNTVPKPVHYKPSEKPYIVDHVHGVKLNTEHHIMQSNFIFFWGKILF